MRHTLPKKEILRGYQSFANVLSQGKSFVAPPIRSFFLVTPSADSAFQVGFSVIKSVRSAVLRNRLKRLLREAVRLHKDALISDVRVRKKALQLLFMYVGRPGSAPRSVRYSEVEQSVIKILSEVQTHL